MIYRDVPIEARPEPVGAITPRGGVIPIKRFERTWKVLTEMSYDEAFPLGRREKRRERI